jgi:hypothetical protein
MFVSSCLWIVDRLVGFGKNDSPRASFTPLRWASRRANVSRASAQRLAAGGFEFFGGQVNAQGADELLRMLQVTDKNVRA